MNHPFTPSKQDPTRCTQCKMDPEDHTSKAHCDCCAYIGPIDVLYGNLKVCPDCKLREEKLRTEHMSTENQQARVDEFIRQSREIDSNVHIKADLFNAKTKPIIDLEAAIMANDSITPDKKNYAVCEELMNRYNHFKEVIFSKRQELIELENEQRVIQVHLQQKASQLRSDEQAKLKLSDLTYTPSKPKVVKPASEKAPAKKFSMKDVKDAAAKHGVPANLIQMIALRRNMTPDEAAIEFKKQSGM